MMVALKVSRDLAAEGRGEIGIYRYTPLMLILTTFGQHNMAGEKHVDVGVNIHHSYSGIVMIACPCCIAIARY